MKWQRCFASIVERNWLMDKSLQGTVNFVQSFYKHTILEVHQLSQLKSWWTKVKGESEMEKLDSQCKRECLDCKACKYAHLCAKLMRVKYISKPKV